MSVKLGYLTMEGRGTAGLILGGVADRLRNDGFRPSGVVQSAAAKPGQHPCETALRILPDGPRLVINQNLGPGSRGCRLDAGALELAVAEVSAGFAGADVLIVNKFGKQETAGRGFCSLIVEALDRDIPVVIGVNRLNLPAFLAFAGDLAEQLAPEESGIIRWLRQVLSR
ncbi:MAG: 3-dehydroquinate dehydratase [Yangia sp.]|nr:3-dehydroquinate dehydratase [Salipiger sp.]